MALEPVDDRWEGIDVIALREANALNPRLKAFGGDNGVLTRKGRPLGWRPFEFHSG